MMDSEDALVAKDIEWRGRNMRTLNKGAYQFTWRDLDVFRWEMMPFNWTIVREIIVGEPVIHAFQPRAVRYAGGQWNEFQLVRTGTNWPWDR